MASQTKVDAASAGVEAEPAAASDLPRFTGILRPLVDRVARAQVGVHAKLLVAFLLGTFLVMLLSILCLTILARLAGHVDDLARLQQKVESSQQLEYLVTLQSHLRAMALLTRDDSNNQKLENAKNDFRVRLETLQLLGGSDYSDFIRSVQATDQRFGIAGSRVLDAYRAGNLDEAIRVHLREEHAISHELEAAMQQLQRDTIREMLTSHAAFLADRGVLRLVVILSSLLALIGAVISGFVFSFAFIIPIRKMKAALTGLAGGDFSRRVTIINNDEFGALGDSLNITSHRLAKLYGDLQELNQEFQDKNLMLVIEGQKRTQRTRVLVEVMRSLSSEFDLDRLLDKIMGCMTTVMQADRSTIFILDAAKHELIVKAAKGIDASGTVRIPANKGIVGHVVTTGEVVNIASAYDDKRFDPSMDRATRYRTKSLLAVPMRDEHGHVTGVVECINKLEGEGIFTTDDAELLEALAAQAAVALRVAHTVQRREAQLRQQVQELQIKIDESKRASQVSEIVQGDYFQQLQAKAAKLRRGGKGSGQPEAAPVSHGQP